MSYNTKNYTAQGGSVTVIGGELLINGKLTIAPGAEIAGLPGGVAEGLEAVDFVPATAIPDSTATTVAQLRADFNLLLANLREAGLLAAPRAKPGDESDDDDEPDNDDDSDGDAS